MSAVVVELSLKSTLCRIISDAVVSRTRDDAKCKGVWLFSSCAAMSAPYWSSSRTISVLPLEDARCKGVEQALSCMVTSAPCSINTRTVSVFAIDSSESVVHNPVESCQHTVLRWFKNDAVVVLTGDDT